MADEKRDPVYLALMVGELIALVVVAVCFAFIVMSMERNIDALSARPVGVSKYEFTEAIDALDNDVYDLQKVTPHAWKHGPLDPPISDKQAERLNRLMEADED